MTFDELVEFTKDLKNLLKKYRTLNEDLEVVKKVLEVLQNQHITEIPDVPDFVKGVINFRGDILPVIDTRIKFKIPIVESIDKACL